MADTPKVDEDLMRRIYGGQIPTGQIDPEAYRRLGEYFQEALDEALTKVPNREYDRNAVRMALQHNVWAFSGSKLYHHQKAMSRHLVDDDAKPRSYEQFRARVVGDGEIFNDKHLRTEYHNAVRTARAAEKWQHLQKYDALEYRTVGDERVRKTHESLHGKVFATSDPIWKLIYPPNGWNCRCTVIPAHGKKVSGKTDDVKMAEKDIPQYFRKNAGLKLSVFHDDHSIFQATRAWGQSHLSAVKNYGLPTSASVYKHAILPEPKLAKSREEARAAWPKRVRTIDGLDMEISNELSEKIIESDQKEYRNRYHYATVIQEILQHPDEVWSQRRKGNIEKIYLKWYRNFPVVVVIRSSRRGSKVVTIHPLDRSDPDMKRHGVLQLYKNVRRNNK